MENAMNKNEVMPGSLSVTFKETDDFNTLCCRLAGYSSERFEAIALRFFSGEETIITIYARDKMKNTGGPDDRIPVHKFKVQSSLADFFNEIRQLNFTISSTQFDLWEMEVVNK